MNQNLKTNAMKKISSFLLLIVTVVAVNAQDTLVLKNGSRVGGKFLNGNQGVISLQTASGIVKFKTDEVASMSFCTPTKGNGDSQGVSAGSSASSSSYSCNNCDDNRKNKGRITFACNMCSGAGRLEIKNENGKEKDGALLLVTLDSEHHNWLSRQILPPGNYKWTYSDTGNNAASGSFNIQTGDEKKIVLFEKEN